MPPAFLNWDDPELPECLKVREAVKRTGVGHYRCPQNHLHIFTAEILDAIGADCTEENYAMVEKLIRETWGT